METRPAPGAPPPYVRVVSRVTRKSLRPVVMFTAGLSCLWSLAVGVRFIQELNDNGETSKMKTFDLILAILFFVVAGIEVVGVTAAGTQKPPLARIYFLLSGIAALITFSAELIRLIAHFILKNDLIDQCASNIVGDAVRTIGGDITTVSASDARSLCHDDWQRGIYWDIGWLLISTVLALMFATIAAAYYHQLMDPTFQRTQAPSNAFRMGAWHQQQQPQYPQDPPFVPPYPGPTPAAGYAPAYLQRGPVASGYAPPAGAPPPEYAGAGYHGPEKDKDGPGSGGGGGGGGGGGRAKEGDDVGRSLTEEGDSAATLQAVNLSDDRRGLAPGEGRV